MLNVYMPYILSLIALSLFIFGLSKWGDLTAPRLAWLAFTVFLFLFPWLPVSEISFGSASMKLLQKAAVVDNSQLIELRAFEKSINAQVSADEAKLQALQAQATKGAAVAKDALKKAEDLQHQATQAKAALEQAQLKATKAQKEFCLATETGACLTTEDGKTLMAQ